MAEYFLRMISVMFLNTYICLAWQIENAEDIVFAFKRLWSCQTPSREHCNGPQLIFVVSWLCCTFVTCSRITKYTKKRASLRPIYSLGLHISGMRDVAKIYLGVHAGLNVYILIEETAAIGHTRYFRIFQCLKNIE